MADNAELVALGIGHHHPRDGALADVEPPGTQLLQPCDKRGLLFGRDGRQVEVHAVLRRLRPGHAYEDQRQLALLCGSVLGRLDHDLVSPVHHDRPAQRGGPEPGQARRVGGIHHDLHEVGGHPQGLPQ